MSRSARASGLPVRYLEEGEVRGMRLRTLLGLTAGLSIALALGAAASLIRVAGVLRETVDLLGDAVESVRANEELELALLTLDRERQLALLTGGDGNSGAAALARREVETLEREIERYVSEQEEKALVLRARQSVRGFLEALDAAAPTVVERTRLTEALTRVEAVAEINVLQARAARQRAVRLEKISNGLGRSMAAALVVGVVLVAGLMAMRVYRPLVEIRSMVRRFRDGDHSARVVPDGPRELREIASELNDMASALSNREQDQLRFIAGVAHDLRNPLQALKLTAGAVGAPEKMPPERLKQVLGRVSSLVHRLDRMIGDLLDRSRIQSGELRIQKERVDLRGVANEVVELFRPTSDRHAITLTLPDVPVVLECDPTRLEQVLTNLVSNALKYSPDGGEVEVKLEAKEGEVRLSVRDEGLGIAEDEQERIFEPFRRNVSARQDIPGVGLGLSVAKKIVQAHGGRLEVSSRVNGGSTFTVVLPREALSEAEQGEPASPPA